MRALQRCDFCDAEAVGTFETIPPELAPGGVESRRIVLCDHCRALLEDVLEPLLAAVSDELETAELDSIDRPDHDGTTGDPADSGEDDRSADAEGESGNLASDKEGVEAPDDEGVEAPDEGPEPVDPADEAGEITFDDETSDRSNASPSRDAVANRDDRPPEGYGKVLRLLRNREFPVERDVAEALAAGAYDLETHEVDAIIEHALDRGEFVEERGKLNRP